MKISQLLDIHQKFFTEYSLISNFGDSYLYHHNKLYKNIRLATVHYGFSFTENTNIFYQTLPLVQLEPILSDKKIPYLDNVSALKQLSVQLHDVQWPDLAGGLKKNYLFHESCHAVARSVFRNHTFNKNDLVLQMLIEESFANTCELLAIIDAQDPVHRIFYEQNSYTWLPDIRTNLKNAAIIIDESQLFKFILLSYLHSNFLRTHLTEKELIQILELIVIDKSDSQKIKILRSLSKIAFTLDFEFRTITTRLHLKLNKQNIKLEAFDFMKILSENDNWLHLIDQLTRTALATPQ